MTFLNKVSWLRNTHVYDLKHNQNLNTIKSWLQMKTEKSLMSTPICDQYPFIAKD